MITEGGGDEVSLALHGWKGVLVLGVLAAAAIYRAAKGYNIHVHWHDDDDDDEGPECPDQL